MRRPSTEQLVEGFELGCMLVLLLAAVILAGSFLWRELT